MEWSGRAAGLPQRGYGRRFQRRNGRTWETLIRLQLSPSSPVWISPVNIHTHTHVRTHTHTHVHTHAHKPMHACMHKAHTHTPTVMHTLKHTHTHTQPMHARTDTRTWHTCTNHTHMRALKHMLTHEGWIGSLNPWFGAMWLYGGVMVRCGFDASM